MSFELDSGSVIALVNSVLVGAALVAAGAWLAHGELSVESPSARQNVGEFVLRFFYGKARDMAAGADGDRIVRLAMPLLASFFLFIFASNLVAMAPVPVLNRPPTSHFSITLALALCSVIGTLVVSSRVKGVGGTIKHLFWPNPMQWVSEFTDVLSLSLRLFGNIAGEFLTVSLVLAVVPYGIPLILHALGLIPAFVQALVFTLLTSSFMASAIHKEEKHAEETAPAEVPATAAATGPIGVAS